jgi:hypothetical protein
LDLIDGIEHSCSVAFIYFVQEGSPDEIGRAIDGLDGDRATSVTVSGMISARGIA